MTEQEKVINKVKAIVADMQEEVDEWKDYSDSELSNGLTCDCDWWYKTLQTLKDALALLKAQEPRVMTFDEVKEHFNLSPVFVDDFDMQEDYYQDIQPLYFDFPNPTPLDVHWRGSNQVRTYLEKWEDRYNKTWRCWTSRPDEKRRAETPWDS